MFSFVSNLVHGFEFHSTFFKSSIGPLERSQSGYLLLNIPGQLFCILQSRHMITLGDKQKYTIIVNKMCLNKAFSCDS